MHSTLSPIIDPGHTHAMFVIIWTSVIRLLFSMSFYVYITSILDLASQCNDKNSGKQGKIIALLNLPWYHYYSILSLDLPSNISIGGLLLCYMG